MAFVITSLDGCPATITVPSTICQPDPTQVPTCDNVTQDVNCCNSWSTFASSEYACISSHISCFTGTGYGDLCKSITGAGAGPTATGTVGPTATTRVTTTAAATATATTASPAPTKNGSTSLVGTTRSIYTAAMVLGVFVYLMA